MWLEDSLYALLNTKNTNEAFELEDSTPDCWAIVARKEHLKFARGKFPHLPLRDGLILAGVNVRRIRPEEIPFQFDSLLKEAQNEENANNWKQAAEIYGHISEHYHNQLWMKTLVANALFKAGNTGGAAQIVSVLNQKRPIVDTLLLEAKLKREQKDFNSAAVLLKQAEDIFTDSEVECVKAQHCKIA